MKKITVKCPKCNGYGGFSGGSNNTTEWHRECDLCKGARELVLEVLKEEEIK